MGILMRPGLPALQPLTGVRYIAEMKKGGKTVSLTWYAQKGSDAWGKILEAVRALPSRKYNAATKRWEVPAKPDILQWLSQAGFPAPQAPAEEKGPELPKVDPAEEQRKRIEAMELDPNGTLIPGLRPYQVDFVKFAAIRHGRVALGDEMGCIEGSTEIQVCRHRASRTMSLEKFHRVFHATGMDSRARFSLEERPWFIRCLHQDGLFRLGQVVDVIDSGMKPCVRITLEDGRELVLTHDHLVKTEDGWVKASESMGVQVMCNGVPACRKCGSTDDLITYPGSKFLGMCRKCMYGERTGKKFKDREIHEVTHSDGYVYLYGYPLRNYRGCKRTDGVPKHRYVMEQHLGRYLLPGEVVHHIDGNPQNNDISNLALLDDQAAHTKFHRYYKNFGFVAPHLVKVVDVSDAGTKHTYDVKVLNHGNFLANRIVVHNCGKTLEALSWMVYADAFPALIVVNAPTKLQWMSAYYRWVGSVPGMHPRVGVLSGRTPYMLEKGVSYIINWDILSDWSTKLASMGFKLLIGDEVQAIGNPKSQRARAFISLSKAIPHVIGMSGTPAMSKPAQFWPLLHIMEPDKFGNYYRYLNRYCQPKHNGFSMTYNGASHVEELHALLVSCMLRRTKDQVMKDLPPKVMEVVPLEVDVEAMNEYRRQEAQAFNDQGVSDKEMRERVAGLLRTAYALKEPALMQWVLDFLESGRKLLLFAWHRDVVDLIYMALKDYSPARIYGGMSNQDREAMRQKFITDPACRVMVANIQSGGVGIDGFQEVCSDVAFAEFSHTPNYHRQAEDRLHRSGQHNSVTSYYLVAPGTVDMDAVEVLDDRAKMLDGVLDGKEAADIDLLTELLERRGLKRAAG